MKFSVERKKFNEALLSVGSVVSSRTTMPILTGVKIEVTEGEYSLIGSNSDTTLKVNVPATTDETAYLKVEKEGSVVIPAKTFTEVVKKLSGDMIDFEVDENFQINIKSGKAKFKLSGLDAADFPKLPNLEEGSLIVLPTATMQRVISNCGAFVSNAETRPVLTGVNMTFVKGEVEAVATDSHRLASLCEKFENDEELAVIIPGNSLNEVNKLLGKEEEITVMVGKNQILFEVGEVQFYSRLLDGNFPATKNMIPNTFKTTIEVNRKELVEVLERCLVLGTADKNSAVHASVTAGNVNLSSTQQEVGAIEEDVTPISLEGEELKIAFNGKNVTSGLKLLKSEEVIIQFTGAMSPFIIKPKDQDGLIQLYSPVRTY